MASLVSQLVKNLLQCRRPGFNPWVGKIPWRRERLQTPVFWPGEFHELYIVHGVAKSTRDWVTFTSLYVFIAQGTIFNIKAPDAGKDWGREEKGEDGGWDGWMASPTQWTWVWANSRRQWRTGKPGVLPSMFANSLTQFSDWTGLNNL